MPESNNSAGRKKVEEKKKKKPTAGIKKKRIEGGICRTRGEMPKARRGVSMIRANSIKKEGRLNEDRSNDSGSYLPLLKKFGPRDDRETNKQGGREVRS